MPSTRTPATLTPDDRARQLARLLATGLVRLGSTLVAPAHRSLSGTEEHSNSETNELAVAPQKSATGTGG